MKFVPMLKVVKKWVPHCFEAFEKYRRDGKELSGAAIEVIKRMVKGEEVSQENSGLSAREWNELSDLINK